MLPKLKQGKDIRCAEYDSMEIDGDLEGEGRVYFYIEDNCLYDEFRIEVNIVESQKRYEIDFESSVLSYLDFTMDCEVRDDTIDCEGDELWAGAEWTWEMD